MRTDAVSSPEVAARWKAEFYDSTGLNLRQVEEIYLGTWAGCQAHVELGPSADIEAVIEYAESVFDTDDPSRFDVSIAAHEARWGDFGLLISDSALQEVRQEALSGVGLVMRQLIELREGEI